jgi:hypothetical protein
MNNDITVTLGTTATIDTVLVNGNGAGLVDESASRFPNAADTGDDAVDIRLLGGTPGRSNGLCGLVAGDAVINEVNSDPQQDWDHDGLGTAFNGTVGIGTVGNDDEYVELKNTSGAELDLRGCILSLADTTPEEFVFQEVDAVTAPYVRVFDDTGTLVGNADKVGAVPDGGYVLVGNPDGVMNLDIVVSLEGAATIDEVDFGADATNLNASDIEDEVGARVPDGVDTGVGANDFLQQRGTPGTSNAIDECTLGIDNCGILATCVDAPRLFSCACDPGYLLTGVDCIDVDECTDGTDNCAAEATCANTPGSFTCTCDGGYEGDGATCDDVDECGMFLDNCSANATCANNAGGFTCTCNDGYEGNGITCTEASSGGCGVGGSGQLPVALLFALALLAVRRREVV